MEWFKQKDPSEQHILLLFAMFLVFFLLFFFVLRPLNLKAADSKEAYEQNYQTYEQVQKKANELLSHAQMQSQNPNVSESVESQVTSSASRFGIRITKVNSNNPQEVEISVTDSKIDDFLKWLDYLKVKHLILLDNTQIDRLGYGRVSIKNLKFKRGK